jgi:flagellar biosynthesis protein FlhA
MLVIGIIIIIVVPLSTVFLDVLLIVNIGMALMILLTALFIETPMQFSSFPSLLLIVTLFRLSLNISSTRLILGDNGNAGHVIETFGNFVISGNPVVGLIIFLIIVIIQFVVITKGAERVSEVAARFTLDAMPGKQMAIDADLSAGLIDDKQAKKRREDIQSQADFYGSMDGASKFVKGDAIAGIIITLINLIGGIIIGLVMGKQSFSDVVNIYTLATVGDGLVSQVPALLISVSTGIILTRSASKNTLNDEILGQLTSQYEVLFISGATLILMTFIPGLPKVPLILFGTLLLGLGYKMYDGKTKQASMAEVRPAKKAVEAYDLADHIFTDPIIVEFGYNLVALVDRNQGGKLLDRLLMIRRQMAVEWGIIVPKIRVKDNSVLMPSVYHIKINGIVAAEGEILTSHYMAIQSDEVPGELEGIETMEPAFGMPAIWIEESQIEKAEMHGYTVIDAISVMVTHISEVIRSHGHELLGRQEVKTLVEALEKRYPALVEDSIPDLVTLGTLQKVLCNLLEEGIKIKNLPAILGILADYAPSVMDLSELTEKVRLGLKKEICEKFSYNNRLDLLLLDPNLEQRFAETLVQDTSSGALLNPKEIQMFTRKAVEEYNQAVDQGYNPVLVTAPLLRKHLWDLLRQSGELIDVISVTEIVNSYELNSVGSISI